jgi:hypothetical protein
MEAIVQNLDLPNVECVNLTSGLGRALLLVMNSLLIAKSDKATESIGWS